MAKHIVDESVMGVITEKHQIFYNALCSIDKLVNSLYNSNQHDKSKINADLLISTAREAYLKMVASMTPKVHNTHSFYPHKRGLTYSIPIGET